MQVRRARLAAVVVIAALVLQTGLARPARADQAAPLLTVAKTTLFGGLIGLVLGGVTALVVDSDDRDDAVRWGIVLGSFGGFGYGIWAVSQGSEDDFFGRAPGSGSDLDRAALLARAGVGVQVRCVPEELEARRVRSTVGVPSPAWSSGASPCGASARLLASLALDDEAGPARMLP